MTAAYGAKLVGALSAAAVWHRHQVRKHTHTPYIGHPLVVTALVLEDGGTEDEACAGVLHDALEDTPATLDDLRQLFGDEVARIVVACTDTAADGAGGRQEKLPWKPRKDAHLEQLRSGGPDAAVARVAAADKLANARSMLDDFSDAGPAVWSRFKGGLSGTVWYLDQMAGVLGPPLEGSALARRLEQAAGELKGVEAAERFRLGGSVARIAAGLQQVPADAGLGWHPADAEMVGFEIARRLDAGCGPARTAAWEVVASWYAHPLPADAGGRAEAIARLERDGRLLPLATAAVRAVTDRAGAARRRG